MERIFERLAPEEVDLMLKAPILVCILIAGADGRIERREIQEAIAVAGENLDNDLLAPYFAEVVQDFEDKVMILRQIYPRDHKSRAKEIEQELGQLSGILKRLDPEFGINFYQMMRELAQKIASSSGGILGINSIGPEEMKYVDLPMISSPS